MTLSAQNVKKDVLSAPSAGAKYVWFETTGISGVKAVENNGKDAYTVTGIRVNKSSDMPKGIYIVGGKKVVVK